MEFAKYHNAMEVVKEMIEKEEIYGYSNNGEINYEGVYVCLDTNDFWLCRILKGYDEEYEDSDGYLVERNNFDIYQVAEKLEEIYDAPCFNTMGKNNIHKYFSKFTTKQIIKVIILLDVDNGFENWDNCEADTLEEAIEIIDGGFGIVEDF
jgi:hypothetical protein